MIQDTIRQVGGIGIYGVISVVMFFVFFTGATIWALRLKKGYVQTMETLPLDDTAPSQDESLNHE